MKGDHLGKGQCLVHRAQYIEAIVVSPCHHALLIWEDTHCLDIPIVQWLTWQCPTP